MTGTPDDAARTVTNRRALAALVALTAAFFALYTALGLARLRGFAPRSIDLAFYTQMLWSLAHGGAPMTLAQGAHPLTLHVMPVLAPLALLVRAGVEPGALLVAAHAAALALALPAAHRLGGWFGVLLALLCPALTAQANFDVHPDVWAFAPLLLAVAFERDGQHRAALVAWAAAFACRESLPLLALVAAAAHARAAPAYARRLALLASAWLAAALAVMLAAGGGPAASITAHFGHRAASEPGMHALTARPWIALAAWTAAAGLLAPLAPRVALPALATLALNSLSSVRTTLWVTSHYAAPAFPFLLGATVAVVRAPPRWLAARRGASRALAAAALACTACAYALRGDGPLARGFIADERPPPAARAAYARAVGAIAPGASVAASFAMGPAVAARARAYADEPPRAGCDVVALAARPQEFAADFAARVDGWLAADPALGVADAPHGAPVLRLERGRDRRAVALARGWIAAAAPGSAVARVEPGGAENALCVRVAVPADEAMGRARAALAVRASGAGVALAFPGDGLWTPSMAAAGDHVTARLCGPRERLAGRALSWRWVTLDRAGAPHPASPWRPLSAP